MLTNETAIQFDNVFFSYDAEENAKEDYALCGVSLTVRKGEFLAVLGHNGSGKSTLARLADGLLTPTRGKIAVFGEEVKESTLSSVRRKVGIVFQNPDNQAVASVVEDDVAFGPENLGVAREEIGKRIDFALDAVEMQRYRHAMTSRLSGGQKQRVALAGVLALCPDVMILDESTAMLDPRGRREIASVVKRLNKERGMTVLFITHFPEEALLADRAIVMNRGEIVMQGEPREILKKEEELSTFNLALPSQIALCRKLRAAGADIPDTLSPSELADALVSFAGERKRFEGGTEKQVRVGLDDKTGGVFCKDLSYVYNARSPFQTQALKGVSLTVESGEFFGIIGHTGSGKSTFVQHLNALIKLPTAEKKFKREKGKTYPFLVVNGFDLSDRNTDFKALRKRTGMVFQYPEYQLFADTVFEDVAFGLTNFSEKALKKEEIAAAVKEALETVGLDYEEIKDRSPFELSGGQKRRVAIAGVIVTKPEILVLDEPAAGLDPLGKLQISRLLHKVHADWCKTVIVVSHDMDEIAENCTRAAIFADGKVLRLGTPKEIFSDPDALYAEGLDVPFTAKVQAELKKRGIIVSSDLTTEGFLATILSSDGEGKTHA